MRSSTLLCRHHHHHHQYRHQHHHFHHRIRLKLWTSLDNVFKERIKFYILHAGFCTRVHTDGGGGSAPLDTPARATEPHEYQTRYTFNNAKPLRFVSLHRVWTSYVYMYKIYAIYTYIYNIYISYIILHYIRLIMYLNKIYIYICRYYIDRLEGVPGIRRYKSLVEI